MVRTVAPASFSAPFVLEAPAAVLAALAEADPDEDALEDDDMTDVDAAALEDEGAAVPPIGAVDWPSICDWTVALNVPVMPAIVNLAENARAGYWV